MSMVRCSIDNLMKTIEKEVKKDLKQVEYAASVALNNTAFQARANLIDEYNKSFIVRNSNLPKAVTVEKATKEKLVAKVSFPKDWMYINAKGGDKKPESAKLLMVPIKGGDLKDFRLSSGKIKRSKKPSGLLKYMDSHPTKKRGRVENPHPFLITSKKTGQTLIAVRDKDDRSDMKWLYVGVPVADVKKKWDFDKIVKDTADKELTKNFDIAFDKAMATAK